MRLQETKHWALAAAFVAASALCACSSQDVQIVVSNQESGEVYYTMPATDGTKIELSWIHSIEKEPWIEIYEIDEGKLFLQEIILEGYGAGVPSDPGGVTTIENGVIHTRDIHRELPELRWVHSHNTSHTLVVGDHTISTDDIEHHAFVELSVED